MESKLARFASLSQKDKAPAYLSLLPEILSRSNSSAIATDLHSLVDTVVNQDSVGLVVGRQVLSELVKSLGGGIIKDNELRKRIVEDTLATVQPRITSYEEQVSTVTHPYCARSELKAVCRLIPCGFN
jgi:COP9 signalosome complex subunit 4